MATRTWLGAVSNVFSLAANWVEVATPGTGDSCIFNGSGGGSTTNACTLTANITVGSIDFTGYTGTFTHNTTTTLTVDGTGNLGNLAKFVSGMTYTAASASSVLALTNTSGTLLLSCGTKQFGGVTVNAPAGTVQLQDDLLVNKAATSALTITAGTFDTNAKNLTANQLSSSNSNTRTIAVAGSSLTIPSTIATLGSVNISMSTTTNLTFTGGSTAAFRLTGAGLKWVAIGAITGSPTLPSLYGDNTGTIYVASGANTWQSWQNTVNGVGFVFQTATTHTLLTALALTGSASQPVVFESYTPSTASGIITCPTSSNSTIDYGVVRDVFFTQTSSRTLACTNTIDGGGNNTAATFTISAPSGGGSSTVGVIGS